MAKYEALCSFATIDKAAAKGSIVELDDVTAKDLLRAGYVKAVAAKEPVKVAEKPEKKPAEPVKKKTTRIKATKKEG